MSQNSGLDEVGLENFGKGKSTATSNSNKTGLEPVNQATGIPKFNSQVYGKKADSSKDVDNQLEDSVNNKKRISPALTQAKGKEGKESSIPTQLEPSKISPTIPGSSNSKISPTSLLTRPGSGKTGKDTPTLGQESEINGEKKKVNPPINPRNPGSGKFTSRLSLTTEQLAKWEESQTKG